MLNLANTKALIYFVLKTTSMLGFIRGLHRRFAYQIDSTRWRSAFPGPPKEAAATSHLANG
jgi:hypothetical protein